MFITSCDNCGKEFYKKPSRIAKTTNNFCCSKCYAKYRHNKRNKELSNKIGMNIDEWLRIEYIQNQQSTRKIANLLFGNSKMSSSVNKLLREFNIPLRHGSEAIKTQWIDAEERREKQSKDAAERMHTETIRNKIRDKLNNPITRAKISASKVGRNNPSYTHGKTHTRLYNIWRGMKKRCYNPNQKAYKNYGGRGISICPEWLDKENGFTNFYNWAMSHGYSDDLSIDRINVDRGYSPDNCRWVDMSAQSFNRRMSPINTSGKTGVNKTPNGKYQAYIRKNNKLHHLGYFDTLEEAIEARERAEREFYPELFEEST